jgi:hypothetical protein
MTRDELELLERQLMAEVVKRRNLGGYNSEAECLMLVTEALYKIAHHLREKSPRKS